MGKKRLLAAFRRLSDDENVRRLWYIFFALMATVFVAVMMLVADCG